MQRLLDLSIRESFLVDFARWLGRATQYGARHPSCAVLADKALRAAELALREHASLVYGVDRDGISIDGVAAVHPTLTQRLGPLLHERGVLALRFGGAITLEDLTAFVEIVGIPAQTIFDRGGMAQVARERGILGLTIEEIAHEVTHEERDAQRRRQELSSYFGERVRRLIARRFEKFDPAATGELLAHPEIAVSILEDDPLGLAQGLAALCVMARDLERRTGESVKEKLRAVVTRMAPSSWERAIVGLVALVGEFRAALVWALEGLGDDELAKMFFAALERHTDDPTVVFYAFAVAMPHDGRRASVVRRVGLVLYDLDPNDGTTAELLATAAAPVSDYDSYRRERDCIAVEARRVLRTRGNAGGVDPPVAAPDFARDAGRVVSDVIALASSTRRFDRLCQGLPAAGAAFAKAGRTDAVMGLLQGLHAATVRPEWRDLAVRTLQQTTATELTREVLKLLDVETTTSEGSELAAVASFIQLLVACNPTAVLDGLELAESRKMRRLLLDGLGAAAPRLIGLVRERLRSPQWFVVRNAVALLSRAGGPVSDLFVVANHPHEKVRLEVLRALRAMPPEPTTMAIVASYLTDPAPDVRQHAKPLLRGELVARETIAAIEQVAMDDKQPEDVRRRCVEALGRSRFDEAAAALFALLQPRSVLELDTVRDLAARALRQCPAPSAAAHFEQGLHSSAWRVRKACERAVSGA